MAVVTDNSSPLADPLPSVPSDESIREAQALREALRQRLLSRPQPSSNPYWAIGVE